MTPMSLFLNLAPSRTTRFALIAWLRTGFSTPDAEMVHLQSRTIGQKTLDSPLSEVDFGLYAREGAGS